jgi:hypothetical protein
VNWIEGVFDELLRISMISFLINISQNTIIGNLCSLTKMCAKNDYIGIRYNESRDQISEMNRPCRPNFFWPQDLATDGLNGMTRRDEQ